MCTARTDEAPMKTHEDLSLSVPCVDTSSDCLMLLKRRRVVSIQVPCCRLHGRNLRKKREEPGTSITTEYRESEHCPGSSKAYQRQPCRGRVEEKANTITSNNSKSPQLWSPYFRRTYVLNSLARVGCPGCTASDTLFSTRQPPCSGLDFQSVVKK